MVSSGNYDEAWVFENAHHRVTIERVLAVCEHCSKGITDENGYRTDGEGVDLCLECWQLVFG